MDLFCLLFNIRRWCFYSDVPFVVMGVMVLEGKRERDHHITYFGQHHQQQW